MSTGLARLNTTTDLKIYTISDEALDRSPSTSNH